MVCIDVLEHGLNLVSVPASRSAPQLAPEIPGVCFTENAEKPLQGYGPAQMAMMASIRQNDTDAWISCPGGQ